MSPTSSPPTKVLNLILCHLCALCLQDETVEEHYCSPKNPCRVVLLALTPLLSLRVVSSAWNYAIGVLQVQNFFRRVEDAYYPHPWHINTKVRKAILLGRYRVYHTVKSEHGIVNSPRSRLLPLDYHDRQQRRLPCIRFRLLRRVFSSKKGCRKSLGINLRYRMRN